MFGFYFLWFELLSFIVSLICFYKLKGSNYIWFIPFLLYTNIQEWGSRYGYLNINGSNALSLNIFNIVEFAFYSWLFYNEAILAKKRKEILIITSSFFCFAFINILFIQGYNHFHSYSYLLGSLMIIYYACSFFYSLFHSKGYINLLRFSMFWICTGLLFFYSGMFFYYIFFEALATKYIIKYLLLFNILMNIFNIILYTCLSVAFICRTTKSNTIS